MVVLPPIPPPPPLTEPERLLAYDPALVGPDMAAIRAAGLSCPNIVRGLAPWMRERGFTFGADGYLAVLLCRVPEHNAKREVLATFTDANLTAGKLLVVVNHAFPTVKPDFATSIRAVETSTITDPAVRAAFEMLKDALIENDASR